MDVCAWFRSMLHQPIAVIPQVFTAPLKAWSW